MLKRLLRQQTLEATNRVAASTAVRHSLSQDPTGLDRAGDASSSPHFEKKGGMRVHAPGASSECHAKRGVGDGTRGRRCCLRGRLAMHEDACVCLSGKISLQNQLLCSSKLCRLSTFLHISIPFPILLTFGWVARQRHAWARQRHALFPRQHTNSFIEITDASFSIIILISLCASVQSASESDLPS
jgi:hypothetical protein